MIEVEDILRGMSEVFRRTGVRPAVLRCHPSVYPAIHSTQWDARPTFGRFMDAEPIGEWPDGRAVSFPTAFDPRHGALGMIIEMDAYLPVDVWRLCDEEMTLLYDCREGKHV